MLEHLYPVVVLYGVAVGRIGFSMEQGPVFPKRVGCFVLVLGRMGSGGHAGDEGRMAHYPGT